VLDAARVHGAAVAAAPTELSVAAVRDGWVESVLHRTKCHIGQTPQAMRRDILLRALDHAAEHRISDQSPWELVCAMGVPLRAVPSEPTNIKITTPLDWGIAQEVIAPQLDRGQP
jgi:2-C-methyl-D-erythritol 4-phosphate cytidylyltransferase